MGVVSKPCPQRPCNGAAYQKRLPDLEITPLSSFVENKTHYVPHGDLCRPVRGPAVGTRVPGDNDPKVLYISWWIEGLEKFDIISLVMGEDWFE